VVLGGHLALARTARRPGRDGAGRHRAVAGLHAQEVVVAHPRSLLHGFWDSWIHERDVLLARGTEHPADGDATAYAAAYGLFIAAAVASMFGDQVQQKLKLGSDGGGVFDLDSRGAVTLTITRVTTAGPPAAQVADALAGRSQITAALCHAHSAKSGPLSS
jgi:hypothetical protein